MRHLRFSRYTHTLSLERVAALVDEEMRDVHGTLGTALTAMLSIHGEPRVLSSLGGFALTVHEVPFFYAVSARVVAEEAAGRRRCFRASFWLRPGWLERIHARGWACPARGCGIVLDADPVPGEAGSGLHRVVMLRKRRGCTFEVVRGYGLAVAGSLHFADSVEGVRGRARRARRKAAEALL